MKINKWKKDKSIKVFTQLEDVPLPFPPLMKPIQLFGMYYSKDGSLYLEHYAQVKGVLYERYHSGTKILSKDIALEENTKLKTSLHGSGIIAGFERSHVDEDYAYLGFELRNISELFKLAQYKIGTAGHYMGRFEESRNTDIHSHIISGLFEIVDLPVFSIWAAPDDSTVPSNTIITATTQELNNGCTITFFITLDYEQVKQRPSDTQQIVFSNSKG